VPIRNSFKLDQCNGITQTLAAFYLLKAYWTHMNGWSRQKLYYIDGKVLPIVLCNWYLLYNNSQ